MPPRLALRANSVRQLLYRGCLNSKISIAEKTLLPTLSLTCTPTTIRQFTQTPPLYKKKTKADRELNANTSTTPAEVDDPYDFTTLSTSISSTLTTLTTSLSKLHRGGRFNPELLESLRVPLNKDSKKTERLGDLAQVLPKSGRALSILVGEKEHVSSIVSAIQGSASLNLQPQVDGANPCLLNVPVPLPTKDSRDVALNGASKLGETAKMGVQSARSVQQKRLRAMELRKSVRPDDLKRAQKDMEKIVEKGMGEVKKEVEKARRGMEQV